MAHYIRAYLANANDLSELRNQYSMWKSNGRPPEVLLVQGSFIFELTIQLNFLGPHGRSA